MGLRSHRMPDFSPIVIWTRRWLYSIVSPPFFTIPGQGATSSTTSRPCCANRYTAASLVMKMSTMPIVYRLIRLCSPERRSTRRMPPAPTPWVDLRPMLSVQDNLKALSEVNGRWVERALEKTTHRRIILDRQSESCPWRARSLCLQRPFRMHLLPSPILLQPVRRLRRFHASARQRSQRGSLEGSARTNRCSTRKRKSANTFGVMPPSPSRTFMNTWRRRDFCMPSGFPLTRCFRPRFHPACGSSASAHRLVCRFQISSSQLGPASPGDCQGGVASRRIREWVSL